MILFTILVITMAVLAAVALVSAGIVGGATLMVFGDVIVCALIIGLIIKCLFKKKN